MRNCILLLWALFLLASHPSFAQSSNNISISQSFHQYVTKGMYSADIYTPNGYMISFTPREETQGSPYLFTNWVKGQVYLKNGSVLAEPNQILNYNKMNGALILRVSDKEKMDVNMNEIKTFELEDSGKVYSFTQLEQDKPGYFIEMYKDSLYSLYKEMHTKFFKADYVNKGLYESGYKYDRYVDDYTYYITSKDGKTATLHIFNKGELKKLAESFPAAKTFLKSNDVPKDPKSIETFLQNLTSYLNKS